jgi:large repetitive protein
MKRASLSGYLLTSVIVLTFVLTLAACSSTKTSSTTSTTPNMTSSTSTTSTSTTTTPLPKITIAANAPSAGATGVAYSFTLTASGGTKYTWHITAGELPPGLTLDSSSGTISGTPAAAATYFFVAQAIDSTGGAATSVLSITIGLTGPYSTPVVTVTPTTSTTATTSTETTSTETTSTTAAPVPLSIATTSLPDAKAGTSYSQQLTAAGGSAPYSWSYNSAPLPAGLKLDSHTGVIFGTPATAGTFAFNIQAKDSAGASATLALEITVTQ